MKRQTKKCKYCPRYIALSSIKRHEEACGRPKYPKKDRYDLNASLSPEEKSTRAIKAQAAKQETWKRKREYRLTHCDFDELTLIEKRVRILREQNYKCALCSIAQIWNDNPLNFELDHIDGNRLDESRDNLRLVCPNCHSQTPTYKRRNYNGVPRSDSELIAAIKSSTSLYKALDSLGMNKSGSNYDRLRRIKRNYDL